MYTGFMVWFYYIECIRRKTRNPPAGADSVGDLPARVVDVVVFLHDEITDRNNFISF